MWSGIVETFCYAPGMASKPKVAIVGAGNLGRALAIALKRAGYVIEVIVSRRRKSSLREARVLARRVGARVQTDLRGSEAQLIWLCVPDAQISSAASRLAGTLRNGKGTIVLHSSGALTSDELYSFRERGVSAASVHPLMTFVREANPALAGVSFAIEGDSGAVRAARRCVIDLGGRPYSIRERGKAAYHAWGAFASPLLTSLLAASERVAAMAGVDRMAARRRMMPILLQTLSNYASFGAAGAFSGPIIRGDVETVGKHLKVLEGQPAARDVYVALARSALQYLPAKQKTALKKLLGGRR